MKKIIIISLLCFCRVQSYSQLLEDKTNFYIGYQSGTYLGSELFNDQGTISPSFYSNLKSNNGLMVKGTVKLLPIFDTGAKIVFSNSTNWQSESFTNYRNSYASTITIQPVIQIHNPFKNAGLYNALKMFAEISPLIGYSTIDIQNNLFDISGVRPDKNRLFSHSLVYGIEAGIGCEYSFTNTVGTFVNLSMQETFINSPLLIDTRYTLMSLNLGIRLNITKVKRFNY